MNILHPPSPADPTVVITRVAEHQWHALEDDQVVGRGDATHRPDGRLFISIDSWHEAVFRLLAASMLTELPRPVYTVVDEADTDQTASWLLAGFSIARRERGYLLPTDPRTTGLATVSPPAGVTIIPAGRAEEAPLRALDRTLRAEIGATVGWQTMPAEVIRLPKGDTVVDPSKYAVAAQGSDYVGLLRLAAVTRQPRIGLLAVRADHRRRGIARALLAHTLTTLHHGGTPAAWAEVNEANSAATALLETAGATLTSHNLELVYA
ncbi:GNAT family N-acetyltransferase [Catenulispora subtropica]|uniref:GNAT family N-acetyltransferase n=1 Tax=Catenulispora subtropica TaxID=450798 RepID=A0ABN2S5X9_9ACTN